MNESSERKSGAILSYVSIIINTLIQLLYTPLLIKMLGQSEYGLYSLISSLIGYLTVFDLGFGNAIIVYTAKYRAQGMKKEEEKLHGMFKIIFILLGFIAAFAGLVLFFNVENIFGSTMSTLELKKAKVMMLILSFNLFITFSFSIYSSIISAYEKFTFQKIVSILNSLLKPILMIPLLFLGYKSIAMCIVITIVNLLVLASNYIYCRKKLNKRITFQGFDKLLFKTILGYSIWIFLGVIVDKINWSVDQFVLGAVSGTVAVSIYAIASQINTLFINLSTAISNVLLPKISSMIANHASLKELTQEFIKVGRIQYYVIFLMASGFVLFGREFVLLWAGKDFQTSYYVALILILPICFPLIQNLGLAIMQAMNKYKFKSISTVVMSLFNVVISVFLARKYGAIGTAIGTAISLIVCNILLINIYYYKVLGLNVISFWKEILKMTLVFLLPFLLTTCLLRFFSFNSMILVLVGAVLYTILYGFVSYFFVMNSYEKSIVDKFLKKLRLKKVV